MSDDDQNDGAYLLRLYVAGATARSIAAFRNLEKLCEERLPGRYRIEVIDLVKNPQLAQSEQILAVPTVVRMLPAPLCKIIGDLSSTERVLVGLDLRPQDNDRVVPKMEKSMDDDFLGRVAQAQDEKYILRLYIAGSTPQSSRAVINIKAICRAHLNGRHHLTVVDLFEQRERARDDQIMVAPTLVRLSPLPVRRLIGDLSKTERVLEVLDLPPASQNP